MWTGEVIANLFAYAKNKRAHRGLSALTEVSAVGRAAQNHATHMYDNPDVGQYETSGLPGYTTNSVGEIAVGIGGACTSPTEAVDALLGAPFHREIFLFDTTGVGFGQDQTNTDMTK
jgi:uncharacterized protein YkwD